MRQLGPANFIYADGNTLFAHGHRRIQSDNVIAPPGLWQLQRRCVVDIDALPEAGVAIKPGGQDQEVTLLASVPLTPEPWRPLAEGEVLVVRNGRNFSTAASEGLLAARRAVAPLANPK